MLDVLNIRIFSFNNLNLQQYHTKHRSSILKMPDTDQINPENRTLPSVSDSRYRDLRPGLADTLERQRKFSSVLRPLAAPDCDICKGQGYMTCNLCVDNSGFFWDLCSECKKYVKIIRRQFVNVAGHRLVIKETEGAMVVKKCKACHGKGGKWSECHCQKKGAIANHCYFCIEDDMLDATMEKLKVIVDEHENGHLFNTSPGGASGSLPISGGLGVARVPANQPTTTGGAPVVMEQPQSTRELPDREDFFRNIAGLTEFFMEPSGADFESLEE
jgi:hypothetical protein